MSQLSHILTQAEQSMQAYNWDKAQQLYQQALDLEPDHPDAQEGLARLRKLREAQEKIAEWIQDGDQQAKAGAYREALQIYIQALAHAGHWGILGLYADLEAKRNRMREAVVWDDRAQETLREAERYGKQEDWKAAGRVLDSLIHEFPQEPLYKPLLATLEQKRREAEARLGAKDLFSQALAALREDGYEQGIRLLEMIPDGDENYTAAQRMLLQARHRWDNRIKPQLQRVEAAIQDKRWADAFAELNTLRTQYPKNSAWQQLWMQVGMGHGQQLLSEGRQANLQRDFQAAQQCFQQAQQAFEKVLEVRPTHITATRLRDESIDLTNIAIEETQAQSDWDAGKREDAKAALERARRRIEHAQGEGRSYAVIPAVVSAMLDTLQREIERIAEDEKRLREAERLLENRRLQEARQKFEDTLNALLPQAKQHATDGLGRVDEQVRQFKQAMEQGRATANPIAAVNALQEAHDLWPNGPEARQELVSALLRASETMLEQTRFIETVGYCERVLVLDPDNRKAKEYKRQAGIKPEAKNLLQDIDTSLGELERKEGATAQDLEPLLTRLSEMLKRTHNLPEVRQLVTPYYARVRNLRRQWQEYDNLYARTEVRRQAGDWTAAVQVMDQALEVWQDTVPSHLRRQRERWQAVAQEMERVHSACAASLAQARPIYDGAMESENLSSALESFSDALDLLQPLERDFEAVEQAAQDEGGRLPRDVQDLRDAIQTILGRAQVAREAIKSTSPREGLLKVREVIRLQGSDLTMESLAQQLEEEVRGDIPKLLKQSETAIESGSLTQALDLLRQARELQPDDAEIAARYATLEQRQQLADQLRMAENDYRQKLANNSPVDAMAALRRALDALLSDKANLSKQGREALRELLSLADLEEGLALGKAAHWQVAQDKLGQLGKLGQESWAATRAFRFADLWAKLARDVMLRGIVASATQLGSLLEAYEAAADYFKAHPTDDEAIQQWATAEENLITQLNSSARKRLERARKSLEQGEFELALGNLESIEDDFYGETDVKFPNLLEKRDEVENVRTEIQDLTRKAQKLQDLDAQVIPCLKAAEQAFLDGRLPDAEQELKAVPSNLSDAPALAQRVEDLRACIRQTRVEQAAKSLREIMARSQTVLRFATTREQLQVFQQELEGLGNQINLELLPIESRENYYQMLDQVREQSGIISAVATLEEEAQTASTDGEYHQAITVLEKAMVVLPQTSEQRARMEVRLAELPTLIERQESLIVQSQSGLELAEQAFLSGRLDKAEKKLQELGNLREAPKLARRVKDLQIRIFDTRVDQAKSALYKTLTDIQTGLQLATTQERLEDHLRTLKELKDQIDVDRLPLEDKTAYSRALAQVQERYESMIAGTNWETQAETAFKEKDYPKAVYALEQALAPLRGGKRRVALEERLREARMLNAQQQKLDDLFQRGYEALIKEEYDNAVEFLSEVQSSGRDVKDYLRAAQAGQFLVEGKLKYDIDIEEAKLALQQVQIVGQNREPAREIVREAHRLLSELASLEVEKLIEQAKRQAEQLLLADAESFLEQAYEMVKRMEEDYSILLSHNIKSVLRTRVIHYQDNIRAARELWRSVAEAQTYLLQDFRSEQALRLLSKVSNYPDDSEIVRKIKQKASGLLASEKLLGGDYAAIERFLAHRMIIDPEDQQARKDLRWVRVQRKLDQKWNDMRRTRKTTLKSISEQLTGDRQKIDEDARYWKRISSITAIIAVVLSVGAVVWAIVQREPLASLGALPAIIVGIAEPFILSRYTRILEKTSVKSEQLFEQMKQYDVEENKQRQAVLEAMLKDADMLDVAEPDILVADERE